MKIKPTIFLFVVCAAFGVAAHAQSIASPEQSKPTLSEGQLKKINEIRASAAKKAAPIALKFAATVKQIYDNMLADKEDQTLREKLGKQMNEAAAELFAVKGQSIRDMLGVLTPEQKRLVKNEMNKTDAPADLSEIIERVFSLPKLDTK